MNPTKAQVLIVGTMQCCVCGGDMTQADVDAQQAILSTSESKAPVINIIAHLRHFFTPMHQRVPHFELSMAKMALAIAEDRGGFSPQMRMKAVNQIARLERRFGKKC